MLWPWFLRSGLSDADIQRVESSLGYPIPKSYRNFLQHHTGVLRRYMKRYPDSAVLWYETDTIIANHHADPENMTIGGEEDDDGVPWPDNYLLVGTNNGGDFYFIHRDESDPGLWFYDHETREIKRHYDSFDAYLAEHR